MQGRTGLTIAQLCPALIVLALFSFLTAARATIICSEPFDYVNAGNQLTGLNGGIGFSQGWIQQNPGVDYSSVGLTFSDIPVSGGAAYASGTDGIGNSISYRPLSNALNGSYYGMFLTSAIQSNSPSPNALMCGIDLGSPPGAPLPPDDGFGILSPFNGNGLAITTSQNQLESGSASIQGETYLVLFKLDTMAQVTTAWVLSSEQYDFIKTNGITETTLDAPAIGNASNQIWARTILTNSPPGMPITASEIGVYMNAPGGVAGSLFLDELRLSDTSFNEAIGFSPTPTIQIFQSGNIALLAWRTNFPGFTLQQATPNSTNWTGLTNGPIIVGDSYIYPVDMSNSTLFRLRK